IVEPTDSEAVAGVTTTEPTGMGEGVITVNAPCPLTPSLEAVIMVAPGLTAETTPELSTAAIAGSELCHTIGRSLRGAPLASRGAAIARCVWPGRSEGDG